MVTRNETVRRLETAIYCAAIKEAANGFAAALLGEETLPSLQLTATEFESGHWAIPDAYEPVILRIMAEIVVHHRYELSDIQLREVLIRGAEHVDRLIVEGESNESDSRTVPDLIVQTGRRFNWLHFEWKASE